MEDNGENVYVPGGSGAAKECTWDVASLSCILSQLSNSRSISMHCLQCKMHGMLRPDRCRRGRVVAAI